MLRIIWLPQALEDAKRLRIFLQPNKPDAAARAITTLIDGTNQLAQFPEMGRPLIDGTSRRELFLPFGAGGYFLRYIIKDKTINILRIWHSKEKRG